MPYMLLIMEEGERRRRRSDAEGRLAYEQMLGFKQDLESRGVLVASDALTSDTDGVRVAVRGGKRMVTDGPFAESKEIVGGFFLLGCRTKEEAVSIAGECPATEWGTVEVREVGPCWAGAK